MSINMSSLVNDTICGIDRSIDSGYYEEWNCLLSLGDWKYDCLCSKVCRVGVQTDSNADARETLEVVSYRNGTVYNV